MWLVFSSGSGYHGLPVIGPAPRACGGPRWGGQEQGEQKSQLSVRMHNADRAVGDVCRHHHHFSCFPDRSRVRARVDGVPLRRRHRRTHGPADAQSHRPHQPVRDDHPAAAGEFRVGQAGAGEFRGPHAKPDAQSGSRRTGLEPPAGRRTDGRLPPVPLASRADIGGVPCSGHLVQCRPGGLQPDSDPALGRVAHRGREAHLAASHCRLPELLAVRNADPHRLSLFWRVQDLHSPGSGGALRAVWDCPTDVTHARAAGGSGRGRRPPWR